MFLRIYKVGLMELLEIATTLFIFKSVLRHGLLKIEKVFQSGMTIINCDSKT